MDQVQRININEKGSPAQSIISALSNTSLVPSEAKDVEDSNCNITGKCPTQDRLCNGVIHNKHTDPGNNKLPSRYHSTESNEPNKCASKSQLANNTTCYSSKNCGNGYVNHDSSHLNLSSQLNSIALINCGSTKPSTKLKSSTPTHVNSEYKNNKINSSESINGSNVNQNINVDRKLSQEANNHKSKCFVKDVIANTKNNNAESSSSGQTNANLKCDLENTVQPKLFPDNCTARKESSTPVCEKTLSAHSSELECKHKISANKPVDHVRDTASKNEEKAKSFECNPSLVNYLRSADEVIGGIKYVSYKSELQMRDIIKLIQKDLSEPYSIYTYRYFIHNWPKFCFLAMDGDKCVGAIVCKLDIHRKVIRRGYIAMLAVDESYRKMKIGSNLVLKAIRAMMFDDADEVVLETEITNRPALKLYENLGFVRDKRLFRYYLNGVDALRLKLWLR